MFYIYYLFQAFQQLRRRMLLLLFPLHSLEKLRLKLFAQGHTASNRRAGTWTQGGLQSYSSQ